MMAQNKKIKFAKLVAAGNDFVILETKNQPSPNGEVPPKAAKPAILPSAVGAAIGGKIRNLRFFAQQICDRRYGIGADGLLLLEKSKVADVRMRVFNADGSEAEMCGNGARCSALWAKSKINPRLNRGQKSKILKIDTKAGIIEAEVNNGNVKIKLTDPKDLKMSLPIKVKNRVLHVNFINTGVPHAVIFVEGFDNIDVESLGRKIRYHKRFAPAGTNVDFVEILDDENIKLRTYERGVEGETLACGTGSVAAALLSAIRYPLSANQINVYTRSGEILKVYFERIDTNFKNIWLEGKAKLVYQGEYYV